MVIGQQIESGHTPCEDHNKHMAVDKSVRLIILVRIIPCNL
jgi:hypothetical protein